MLRAASSRMSRGLERFAVTVTRWAGSSWAFLLALLLIMGWLVGGRFFGYSDTWQLVMNTLSSVVTFLMVFLIQRSQNKDALAIQIKLNELIASQQGASNRLIGIENLTEEEVRLLHKRYEQLAEMVLQRDNITEALSIEKAGKHIGKDDEPAEAAG